MNLPPAVSDLRRKLGDRASEIGLLELTRFRYCWRSRQVVLDGAVKAPTLIRFLGRLVRVGCGTVR
jgi:hypothetical protein